MASPKSPLASKTVWINFLTVLVGALTVLTGSEWIQDHPALAAVLLLILGLVNVVLRFISTTPLKFLWLIPLLLCVSAAEAAGLAFSPDKAVIVLADTKANAEAILRSADPQNRERIGLIIHFEEQSQLSGNTWEIPEGSDRTHHKVWLKGPDTESVGPMLQQAIVRLAQWGPRGCPPGGGYGGYGGDVVVGYGPRPSQPKPAIKPHPASCRVIVEEGGGVRSMGSGILVDVRDGLGVVLTNRHVVRDRRSDVVVVAFPNGKRYGARVRGEDSWDIAALLIKDPGIEPVSIREDYPPIGETLYAAGYGPQGRYSSRAGRVRDYAFPQGTSGKVRDWIVIGTQVRQGDSGGPIFDREYKLAGIIWGSADHCHGVCAPRLRLFLRGLGDRLFGRLDCPKQPQGEPDGLEPPDVAIGDEIEDEFDEPGGDSEGHLPGALDGTHTARLDALESRLDEVLAAIAKIPAGPQGPKGDRGEPGERGPAGRDGNDANLDPNFIQQIVDDMLRTRPIAIQTVDPSGKPLGEPAYGYLGGSPIKLRLVPVD